MGTDTEIGWGWLTSPSFDGTGAQTWHNGTTGGFRTFLPARRAWLWWPLAVAGLAAAAGITVLW